MRSILGRNGNLNGKELEQLFATMSAGWILLSHFLISSQVSSARSLSKAIHSLDLSHRPLIVYSSREQVPKKKRSPLVRQSRDVRKKMNKATERRFSFSQKGLPLTISRWLTSKEGLLMDYLVYSQLDLNIGQLTEFRSKMIQSVKAIISSAWCQLSPLFTWKCTQFSNQTNSFGTIIGTEKSPNGRRMQGLPSKLSLTHMGSKTVLFRWTTNSNLRIWSKGKRE